MYKRALTVTIHRTGAVQVTNDNGATRRLIQAQNARQTKPAENSNIQHTVAGHIAIVVTAAVIIAEIFMITNLIFDTWLPKQTTDEKTEPVIVQTAPAKTKAKRIPADSKKTEPVTVQPTPAEQISTDNADTDVTDTESIIYVCRGDPVTQFYTGADAIAKSTADQSEPVPKAQTAQTAATDGSFSEEEITRMAKAVVGEASITRSDMHMAAVVWCILNRYDSGRYTKDVTAIVNPGQFNGYDPENPVSNHVRELVKDVIARYEAEKQGQTDVGRILPKDYIYFIGDGVENHFTNKWPDGPEWDWSLPNPYPN